MKSTIKTPAAALRYVAWLSAGPPEKERAHVAKTTAPDSKVFPQISAIKGTAHNERIQGLRPVKEILEGRLKQAGGCLFTLEQFVARR